MDRNRLDTLFLAYRACGDAAALAQVFDLAAPELYELARRLSSDRGAAEDLLQETFVTAIEKRASWDEREPLLPWLVGILAIASQRRRRELARTPDPERVRKAQPERPEETLAAREQRTELESALAALRPGERALVEQRLLEGRSPRDMARELGLSSTTLRMRLSRALARLRRATPSSLSWVLFPAWSARRAVEAVRLRVLPGVPEAAPGSGAMALAASLLGLSVLGGLVAIVACLAPEAPKIVAVGQPAPSAEAASGTGTAAELESTPVAKGAEAAEGAARSSERSAVPKPPPVFRIGTPPPEGEIVAMPDPPSVPRKRVHLTIRRLGVPVPGASVRRLFPDAGYEGSSADEQGRLDLEFVDLPRIDLCFKARGCRLQRHELVPAEIADGTELVVDLEPGPEPVRVRFLAATGFPERWCVRFVPLALLGDRRPDLHELFSEMTSIGCAPECLSGNVRRDGTVEPAVDPGSYWVMMESCTPMATHSQPTLVESSFELVVPAIEAFECQVETRLGGVLLLDVRSPATAGRDISIALVEGGTTRVLSFLLHSTDTSRHCSTAVPPGVVGVRSEILPPGDHELVVRQGNREIERRRVTIRGGDELPFVVSP